MSILRNDFKLQHPVLFIKGGYQLEFYPVSLPVAKLFPFPFCKFVINLQQITLNSIQLIIDLVFYVNTN